VFGVGSFGAHRIVAFLLAIGTSAAFVGDAIAWIVYWIMLKIKK